MYQIESSEPMLWYVGGEDVRMRIPTLLALRELGFSVAAVGSESSTPFDCHGIEYHQYHLERGIAPAADVASCRQLTALFRRYRPDVVHAFDTKPGMLVPVAAHSADISCKVRTVTGMGYVYSSNSLFVQMIKPIYRFMQKRASRLADATIFQNTDDQAYFESTGLIDDNKSFLVKSSGLNVDSLHHNCIGEDGIVRLRSELGLGDGLVVTMVARLVKYKGVLDFLEAARVVKRIMPACQFLLVGPLASEGSQAVPERVVESYRDVVNWLGPRSDVPALLSITDVFVLPTYYREGVPRVLLEAGAMELPLITTDMPGCKDVVRDGVEGLLVKPRDSVSLAVAINKLLSSESLRRQMGQSARQRIEAEFLLEKVVSAYTEIYRQMLETTSEKLT